MESLFLSAHFRDSTGKLSVGHPHLRDTALIGVSNRREVGRILTLVFSSCTFLASGARLAKFLYPSSRREMNFELFNFSHCHILVFTRPFERGEAVLTFYTCQAISELREKRILTLSLFPFVLSCRSAEEMKRYTEEMKMPWFSIDFEDCTCDQLRQTYKLVEKSFSVHTKSSILFFIRIADLPVLLVVDSQGKIVTFASVV